MSFSYPSTEHLVNVTGQPMGEKVQPRPLPVLGQPVHRYPWVPVQVSVGHRLSGYPGTCQPLTGHEHAIFQRHNVLHV